MHRHKNWRQSQRVCGLVDNEMEAMQVGPAGSILIGPGLDGSALLHESHLLLGARRSS